VYDFLRCEFSESAGKRKTDAYAITGVKTTDSCSAGDTSSESC
jgi:hypothetical protein